MNSKLLRPAALIAVLVGSGASLAMMFRVGHRNSSPILLLLFTVWVLSPFVALLFAYFASKHWPALYSVMLIVTLGSVAMYAVVAFGPPRSKPASMFLVVPFAAWLLIAVAAMLSGKRR